MTDSMQHDPGKPSDSDAPTVEDGVPIHRFGRYLLKAKLGAGKFGEVWRAYDEELGRLVAIKLALDASLSGAQMGSFLSEARQAAHLDHPNIVPVYDVGTHDGRWYIVYKLIEGCNLAVRANEGRLEQKEIGLLLAKIADALDHAHRHGIYHRDVKPSNILLDENGEPYLTDFGVAVRESDLAQERGRAAGTYQYMAPEQLRGEGHRIDGRTDIYSFGVVLYELLCRRRPFEAAKREELFELVLYKEAVPPRQINGAIDRELERITLKAMSKRMTDRYTIAADMAEEMRLAVHPMLETHSEKSTPRPSAQTNTPPEPSSTKPLSRDEPAPVVPQGLRPFGPDDSDFFLQLLPGPRDRTGLPESVRFWKSRIEHPKADNSFTVGLMYGPSGCGKTSLVRAGLVPQLRDSILPIYIEATAQDIEKRIEAKLQQAGVGSYSGRDLTASITAVRTATGPRGFARRVLLIIDQFEQWLHAHPIPEIRDATDSRRMPELVSALRQCDGEHFQCLILVRDEFWLAASRFMQALEVPLVEGSNIALVDLFDSTHARRVLTTFGRSYRMLPDGPLSSEQEQFLDRAIQDLAESDKVVPVRLSLFAEMLKGRPWVPATLHALRGPRGWGVAFLRESFESRAANPTHRRYEKPVRAVLGKLLPEVGSQIRGHVASRQQLLEAAQVPPADFERILRILDTELRLVTPVDPDQVGANGNDQAVGPGFYQLTHDYLVPSVRDWLNEKQRQTLRGRATLQLAEAAQFWQTRPIARHLPGLLHWAKMALLAHRQQRTPTERAMLRAATRHHALRIGLVIAIALAATWSARAWWRPRQANQLVDRLLDADFAQVPPLLERLEDYRLFVAPRLTQIAAETEDDRHRLIASLGLLPFDPSQQTYLRDRLLKATPDELTVIRRTLERYGDREETITAFWTIVDSENSAPGEMLRAAAALATLDRESSRWSTAYDQVANLVLLENELRLPAWIEALDGITPSLAEPLSKAFKDRSRSQGERRTAALLLSLILKDDIDALIDLALVASAEQLAPFALVFLRHPTEAAARLKQAMAVPLPDITAPTNDAERAQHERVARARANAATLLIAIHDDSGFQLLGESQPDPSARTYAIHNMGPAEIDLSLFAAELARPDNPAVLRALLLSLANYRLGAHSSLRDGLLSRVRELFREHPDAGVHSACQLMLRRWGLGADVDRMETAMRGILPRAQQNWWIDSQGHTMVIVSPGRFTMGCRTDEPGRLKDAPQPRSVEITEPFAIATTEVTVQEFLQFKPDFNYDRAMSPTPDSPINSVNIVDAVAYCVWLNEQLVEERRDQGSYRLPSEAEWEFACRASTASARFYGETDELIARYAWCSTGHPGVMQPVAQLLPNDLGLFDVYGNAMEWTQEPDFPLLDYEFEARFPRVGERPVMRTLRGGWVRTIPTAVRSCSRFISGSERSNLFGFRIARTLPSGGRPVHSEK